MIKMNKQSRRAKKLQSQIASAVLTQVESFESRQLLSGTVFNAPVAPIDGVGNNLIDGTLGTTGAELLRITSVEYSDGISELAGEDRPSARVISNAVNSQTGSIVNEYHLTDYLWVWGQFLDHDIDLSEPHDDSETADIEVPQGDPFFDPFGTGTQTIGFTRTAAAEGTGTSEENPRQQFNEITAFIDGSVVYGSDQERADALRTFSGGLLKTSDGDLLPFNDDGLANAGGTSDALFVAGDVRANENIALSSMHTIWVREHNRIATELANEDPSLTDEELYQGARRIVMAEIQAITYNEFLPALLGNNALQPYTGYNVLADAGIANIFSTAAYRLGHSLLSPELLRLNADGTEAAEGNISLQNAFFSPSELTDHGIDSLLQGLAAQNAQQLDTQIIDDVRNFLFGPPGAGGFDLASLNIQRGRDHGLADYNQARIDLGLAPVTDFSEISSDVSVQLKLASVYDTVDDIDVWVGMLAEDHVPGSTVGELMRTVLIDQFTRLRDGDRFWYQNVFRGHELREIEQTTLADVIMRNSDVTGLQENVFYDSSVLYYKAPEGSPAPELIITKIDENYVVIDRQMREIVASSPVSETSQIHVRGTDTGNETVVIWFGEEEWELEDGIIVAGHGKRNDRLVVRGIINNDQMRMRQFETEINGVSIQATGFEQRYIENHKGNNQGPHGHKKASSESSAYMPERFYKPQQEQVHCGFIETWDTSDDDQLIQEIRNRMQNPPGNPPPQHQFADVADLNHTSEKTKANEATVDPTRFAAANPQNGNSSESASRGTQQKQSGTKESKQLNPETEELFGGPIMDLLFNPRG